MESLLFCEYVRIPCLAEPTFLPINPSMNSTRYIFLKKCKICERNDLYLYNIFPLSVTQIMLGACSFQVILSSSLIEVAMCFSCFSSFLVLSSKDIDSSMWCGLLKDPKPISTVFWSKVHHRSLNLYSCIPKLAN